MVKGTVLQNKIKIAFVLDEIDYQMGGTEKQILMILDNIDREEFEIHLCLFKHNQWIKDNAEKYNIFYFDFSSFKKLKSYLEFYKFVKFLRLHKFDIVVSFFTDSNKIAVPAARFAGIKNIVLSRRNFNHWVTKGEALVLKLLNPFVCSYWVNASAIKKRLVLQEKVKPESVEVVYNGFELDSGAGEGETLVFKNILQSKLVINVSNLREVKGLDVFIRAAALVVSEYKDVHFMVVGEGEKRPELEKLVKKLGIESSVSLVGKKTNVNRILNTADIGVLSSHSEGLSNAIIEYMAAGLPVVCTEVGGAAEMVSNDENGYLVPTESPQLMAQRILMLIQDDNMRQAFGDVSREKAYKLFQCSTMINHLSSYFKRLAGA